MTRLHRKSYPLTSWLLGLGLLALALLLVIVPSDAAQSGAATAPPVKLNPNLPTLFVVGDSTANNNANGAQGWGDPLAAYFDLSRLNVINRARAGRSSRTFITEGLWDRVLADLKPSDFVLIQFGHNDGGSLNEGRARGSLPGLGDETQTVTMPNGNKEVVQTFGWYLRKFIADTKAKQATPILLSLTVRNLWPEGKLERGSGRFGQWAAAVAQAQGVAFVDLASIVADQYEKLGPERVRAFFAGDYAHTSPAGADLNAASVVAGLKALKNLPLASFLSAKGEAVASAPLPQQPRRPLPEPANPKLPSLFLIGDSTVRNGQGDGTNGQWGWGEPLVAYFDPAKINVVNRAVGGLSSRTYLTGGHWERVLGMLKPGDFVLMQFGHNDAGPVNDTFRARGSLRGTGAETEEIDNLLTKKHEVVRTYGWYLRKFIADTKARDATPIVATLVPRKIWREGKLGRNSEDYAKWAAEVARSEQVALIDLNEIIARKYEMLGPEKVEPLFADERTHTSRVGAELNAAAVIEGLQALNQNPLAAYCSAKATTVGQTPPTGQAPVTTRPPENNDQTLRPITPEEIPPNLNFYAIDPLYRPGTPLGWAKERIEEKLTRGLIAQPTTEGKVYLGWRLLKSDPANVAFNLYRSTAGGAPVKLNARPLTQTTDFVDASAPLARPNAWWVKPVLNGREQSDSEQVELPANAPAQPYRAIKLKEDVRGVDRVAVGDLNGDGTYDFVVKHAVGRVDPGRSRPSPDTFKIDAYDGRTGQFMWRIDLGWNINQGIWFSPLVVRDLDGDGRAEVCLRTAPYAATREQALDGGRGFVLTGPEYLSVYDGATGQEIDRVDWIERGQATDWADTTGNRSSRHMLGVAYLDGKTPSVLVVRGTYGLMKVDAWLLKERKLVKVWRWTNERAPFKYQGQGQHSIKTGDIDGDGFDEILNGSIAIDQDGRTMWSTGLGHGDRFYLSDIDPERPGLEIWYTIEDPHPRHGVSLWEARTGRLIFGTEEANRDNQIAGGLVGDIDPNYPGMECWGDRYFFSATGEIIPGPVPPQNELVWWDADLLRELHSRGTISKWRGAALGTTQGSVQLVADLLGDWREELVTFSNGELRLYSTTIPAADRRVCLMQDPLYRNDVTHRSMGYAHVPMTSYYLGVKNAPRRPARAR